MRWSVRQSILRRRAGRRRVWPKSLLLRREHGGRRRLVATSFPYSNLFIGVDAPQFRLFDIALEPVAVDKTPGAVATADVDDHSRLKRRSQFGGWGRAGVDLRVLSLLVGRHQRRSPPRQQRMKNPALDAFEIANLAPYFELGGDFDRKPGPLIDPFGRVILRRALAQVDAVGLQAGEPRQGSWVTGPIGSASAKRGARSRAGNIARTWRRAARSMGTGCLSRLTPTSSTADRLSLSLPALG